MIEKVRNIAQQAGDRILQLYQQDHVPTETKDDAQHSPLTQADLEANEIIIQGLQKVSSFPIVTEESPMGYASRKDLKKFWLVDPLDGTKDFLAKNGEFTVNIALIEENRPVLGVVLAPALELMYWAEKGQGAYKNGESITNDSKRIQLVGSDSRFHSTEMTKDFFKKHNIETVKRYGSALKLCKLAEGEIDVYPRLNGTMEWDTAAAHIIANEAHCKLVDYVTGQELAYNKENMLNNYFVASRNDLNFNA